MWYVYNLRTWKGLQVSSHCHCKWSSHSCCLHSYFAFAQGLFYIFVFLLNPPSPEGIRQTSSHCEDNVNRWQGWPMAQLPCWPLANHFICYYGTNTSPFPPMNCCQVNYYTTQQIFPFSLQIPEPNNNNYWKLSRNDNIIP